MMASYVLYMVCVVLCTVHLVHSYSIKGTIKHDNGAVSEVTVSNYIDGENWGHTRDLTLDRLVDTENVQTLTLANFNSISRLHLVNISLEHVPVFVNTSCSEIYITGNTIKSIPANAFSGLRPRALFMDKNQIQSLANGSINTGASRVYLHCNRITNFSQSWFEAPGNIELLHLSRNRIEYIHDRAFNQMTKLDRLYLSFNHITSIGNEAFGSLITDLHLQFNNIAQLTPDMFTLHERPMEYLLFHHNQLSYLPEALLLKLKPKGVSLFGNPWQCQCLHDIEKWLRELNTTRYDIRSRRGEPVCVLPRSFLTVCIPVVDKELQQSYARRLSPVQGCLVSPCQCQPKDFYLDKLA